MRIGVVMEALLDLSLTEALDWLAAEVPEVTELEIGSGGYAPHPHCDRDALLASAEARRAWLDQIAAHGIRVAALNVWGNPLHPDATIARQHDRDLRDSIRLAALLGVDRIVAMAGCPAADGGLTPHFAGGGWLPYLEGVGARQWEEQVAPYWADLSAFALREHPDLIICLELHPGTNVYNVETFGRLAPLGPNLAANLDPSHFMWQQADALVIGRHLGRRVGYAHGKDVVFNRERLALNGLLDQRWPNPPAEMPWNFAVVGNGHDLEWWRAFAQVLASDTAARTISIEHEDPFVPAQVGIKQAAQFLARACAGLGEGVEVRV